MFTVKDQDPQKKAVASRSKDLDGQTHSGPQMREPIGSLQSLQRNLGNGYLQASNPTSTQMTTDANGLRLQRACACGSSCAKCAAKGNEQRILQPKLTIGSPNDRYEQEADRIADQVMRMPEPSVQRQMEPEEDEEAGMVQRQIANQITPLVQRQVLPEMEEEEEVIQTKTIGNQAAPSTPTQESSEVPPIVHEVLNSPGQPLDPATRAFMEPRFGYDFSHVRVHSGGAAERSAREVNANAYTAGHNIVFGAGQFAPGTQEGRRLLAHELTHFVQQTGGVPLQTKKQEEEVTPSGPEPSMQRMLQTNTGHPEAELTGPASPHASEQATDGAATNVMMDRRVNRQSLSGAIAPAQIQRKPTKMSLNFLSSGSYVTFMPDGVAFSPATRDIIDYTDFPDGFNGEVRIDADTKVIVRFGMRLHIFESNWIIDEELAQLVFVDWVVSAARDGKLKIEPVPKIWRGEPSSGEIRAGLTDINARDGADFVMINPVVASGGGTGGIALGVELSQNAPAQSVSMPFTLRIVVENIPPPKEPTGTVTIGEISALSTHEVRFPEPKHRKGQFTVTSSEITKFAVWYSSLSDTTRKRIEKGELAVDLAAHTSTTGDVAYNEWLSGKRRDSVEQLIRGRLGRDVRISRSRALGELDTPTPDQQESDEWRKVFISVSDVKSEGENPPGSTPP